MSPKGKIVLEKEDVVPYNRGTKFRHALIKMKSPLDNVSIVLVDTKTPANIGSTARAMMNMGVSRLVLVDPPKDPNAEARRLAAGAEKILDAAEVFHTLKDAVSDQGLVIGASRHASRRRKNIHPPRETAEQAVSFLDRNKASLVFGNEVNGLENADIALCHELISIPSADAFPSLNLSHAVMVVLYEFFIAATAPVRAESTELAPARELERFYEHAQKTLKEVEFIDRDNAEGMMFSLRQLFGRARLDAREVSILQGIMSAVDRVSRLRR